MIRNIVFDMGNVLLDYHPMTTCQRFAENQRDAKAVHDTLFMAPEWEEKLDACLISEPDMLALAQSRLASEALRAVAAQVFANYHTDALTSVPGMGAIIHSLHDRGFGLYVLSNAGSRFFAFQHKIPGIECFDGVLTSGEENVNKPSPAIYQRLFEKFGLKPEECLFVDDRQVNIDGAKAQGMAGYLFENEDSVKLAAYLDTLEAPRAAASGATAPGDAAHVVLSALMDRSSYRGLYQASPVPQAHLRAIMEAGLAAPSGCNKQTTSIIAIDDPALLQKLHSVIQSPIGRSAPAMITVLTRRVIAYRDRTYYIHDYAAAIENMLLAIKALGYESCWVEGHITDADQIGRQMADILGVPEDYELVCYLPVGIATEPLKHAQKKPFEERAWFNGFMKG